MITVVANIVVMVALWRVKRAPSHYPLLSLVTADLLVGITVMPIGGARELFVFHLDRALCSMWSTMDVLCCTASILSLCVLGWERWCAITAPLAHARRMRLARLLAVLVWPVAVPIALLAVFIPSPEHHQPGVAEKACTVNTNVGYVFFSIILSFYLPTIVMIAMYTRIIRELAAPLPIRAHRGRTPMPETAPVVESQKTVCGTLAPQTAATLDPPRLTIPRALSCTQQNILGALAIAQPSVKTSDAGADFMARQRRATRTIVTLVGLFLLCWTPFFVVLPVDSLCECVWDSAWKWCTWLGYANSALNPMVYAVASPSVRTALRASFTSTTQNTDIPMACMRA